MPLQNMPLWHIDYFELKETEKQQMQEGHFAHPPLCLKAEHKFPMREVAFLYHYYHWRQGVDAKINPYKHTLLNDPYLLLVFPMYLLSLNLLCLKGQTSFAVLGLHLPGQDVCGQGSWEKLSFVCFSWTKSGNGVWLVLPTWDFGLGAGTCSKNLYKKNAMKKTHRFTQCTLILSFVPHFTRHVPMFRKQSYSFVL